MKRSVWYLVLSLAPVLCAKNPKLAPELDNPSYSGNARILVRYKLQPGSTQHGKAASRGASLVSNHSDINTAIYDAPSSAIGGLASDPDVAYISPDRRVKASLDYMPVTVGATIASDYGWTGAAIGVAVIDSGIIGSPDLEDGKGRSRIVYSENLLPMCNTLPKDLTGSGVSAMGAGSPGPGSGCVEKNLAVDEYGHGTHVAGIIAGRGALSTGAGFKETIRGVAPAVNIVNLRALDAYGVGRDTAVVAAIDRAIYLKSKYNIRVINLSLGRPIVETYVNDPLCQAAERAWAAGIVVVSAAGNFGRATLDGLNGYATIVSPGNDPAVITVGSMRTMGTPSRADDLIATYSSKGPSIIDHVVKPDLVAPGNAIDSIQCPTCTMILAYPANRTPLESYTTSKTGPSSNYFTMSGTSMATPVTSGAAVLLLHKDPTLTPDQVKARLMRTATKSFPASSTYTDTTTGITYVSQYDIFTVGAGYLDVWAALNSSLRALKPARSPFVRYNAATGKVELVADTNIVWGDADWANNIVWGDSVLLAGSNIVWGDSAPWGASSTNTFNIVWGDTFPIIGATAGSVELDGDR